MKQIIYFLVAIVAIAVTSCKKELNEPPKGPVAPDVYIAGYENIGGNNVATVWKNGVATRLPDAGGAPSIAVSGNTVYAAGYSLDTKAMMWKNGVATQLSTESSTGNGIVVSGKDVYIAGSDYDPIIGNFIACLWKNGVKVPLGSGVASTALSVAVSGDDIYVAGYELTNSASRGSVGRLWKNGVNQPSLIDENIAFRIDYTYISDNNIYVIGIKEGNYNSILWKNGVDCTANYAATATSILQICVSGNDVYVLGSTSVSNSATYSVWKNGVPTEYVKNDVGSAESLFVYNGDVYVAGARKKANGNQAITLWKNGTVIDVTDGTNNAGTKAMFIVTKK